MPMTPAYLCDVCATDRLTHPDVSRDLRVEIAIEPFVYKQILSVSTEVHA